MVLKETERTAIENLRTQEKSCIEKYQKYAQQAIDPELKNLFEQLHKKEQTHYDSLTQVLDGTVPSSDCNDSDGRDYEPRAIYTAASQSEDKMHDAFLCKEQRKFKFNYSEILMSLYVCLLCISDIIVAYLLFYNESFVFSSSSPSQQVDQSPHLCCNLI